MTTEVQEDNANLTTKKSWHEGVEESLKMQQECILKNPKQKQNSLNQSRTGSSRGKS